jgi:hypothetical protein
VFVGQDSVSPERLTKYVQAGGNVYVMSGTGYGVADMSWNAFLEAFGLTLSSTNSIIGVIPIMSSHPLFAGVYSLLFVAGNSVAVNATYSGGEVVAWQGSEGLFGTFTAITLPMAIRTAACEDDVTLRLGSKGTLNVTLYGNAEAGSEGVDISSVRLLDVKPLTGRGSGVLGVVTPLVCLATLDGFAGEPLRFDEHKVSRAIREGLGGTVVDGETVLVTLSGRLKPEHGGTAIRAHDTVILRTR